eukprot:m.332619 g.332619  ORF g.332619 m.332619 type:complete len:416 (-) comp16971_c0_seq1:112-1359(-)
MALKIVLLLATAAIVYSAPSVNVNQFNSPIFNETLADMKANPWKYVDTYPHETTFFEHEKTPRRVLESGETEITLYSSVYNMKPGDIIFTDPARTLLPVPDGTYYLTYMRGDMVNTDFEPVPLDEVYLHHWVVLDPKKKNDGLCSSHYLRGPAGIGSESRETPFVYPTYNGNQYGWLVEGDGAKWSANLHIIRTVDLDETKYTRQHCIECHGPNKWCNIEGGFSCCPNGARCPATSDTPKGYHFRYTVRYVEPSDTTRDAALFTLDTSGCQVEYNIKKPKDGSDIVTTIRSDSMPFDMKILSMWSHTHIGANHMKVYHGTKSSDPLICTSKPTYGTIKGTVGHEAGYITSISRCDFTSKPIILKKGDHLTHEAEYTTTDNDPRTFAAGAHDGVMALVVVIGERCKTPGCTGPADQ